MFVAACRFNDRIVIDFQLIEMNGQSGGSGKLMIGVKVDRFWNRHWRLLLFVGVIVLSSITGGTLPQSRSIRCLF